MAVRDTEIHSIYCKRLCDDVYLRKMKQSILTMKNSKRISAFLALAAMASAAFSSCDKNSSKEDEALALEIKIENIQPTGADMTVTPSDETSTFYYDVLGKDAYNHLLSEGLQTYFDGEVKAREDAYSMSREEVLEKLLSTGVTTFSFSSLKAITDYYAVAFGVESDGTVSTELFLEEFSTAAVKPSANTFEITVSNIANDGADYKVVPSVAEDNYVVDIWPKSLVDNIGDGETMRYFIEYNSYMLPMLTTAGEFELENEHVNQPGRDYYVIAFGYADNEPTTALFKKEFRTIGGDPAKCTFKFAYSEQAATSVKVKVTPSDKQVVYIWNVLDMKTFNEYKTEQKTDRQTLEYILNGGIEQQMEFDGVKRQHAVEALGRWSGYTTSDPEGYDEEKISGLTGGEEYIVWAVAVDADGNPEGEFYTDKFTTPAK